MTVIGPHGADTVNAASRVEEDINTEPESVTIHHQQTVVKTVEDQADEREAVIYVLVKVRLADKMRYNDKNKKYKKSKTHPLHLFCTHSFKAMIQCPFYNTANYKTIITILYNFIITNSMKLF